MFFRISYYNIIFEETRELIEYYTLFVSNTDQFSLSLSCHAVELNEELRPTSNPGGGPVRYRVRPGALLQVIVVLLVDKARPPSLAAAVEKVPHGEIDLVVKSLEKQKRQTFHARQRLCTNLICGF